MVLHAEGREFETLTAHQGDWYSWEHGSFASFSQRFDPAILHQHFATVTQWIRVLAYEAGSRRFESFQSHQCPSGQIGKVVSLKRRNFTAGSTPAWGTKHAGHSTTDSAVAF